MKPTFGINIRGGGHITIFTAYIAYITVDDQGAVIHLSVGGQDVSVPTTFKMDELLKVINS